MTRRPAPSADTLDRPCRRDRTVELADGRRLGFAEYGDPEAPPVLYFHGYPSSRLEAGLVPLAGVRLIAPDRPGYGLSEPLPGRRLLDWPRDVAELLDRLGLDKVGLIGMSGGAPFAAACAFAIPGRLTATALVSGMGPPAIGWERRSPAGFLMHMGTRPVALRLAALAARRVVRGGEPLALAGLFRRRANLPAADQVLIGPEVGEKIIAGWREALRHGVQGPLSDAMIYARPWGFDLASIQGRVFVWHGLADRTVPPASGRYLAAGIPGARARLIDGEGHFSLVFRHHPAILADLLAAAEDARAA